MAGAFRSGRHLINALLLQKLAELVVLCLWCAVMLIVRAQGSALDDVPWLAAWSVAWAMTLFVGSLYPFATILLVALAAPLFQSKGSYAVASVSSAISLGYCLLCVVLTGYRMDAMLWVTLAFMSAFVFLSSLIFYQVKNVSRVQ